MTITIEAYGKTFTRTFEAATTTQFREFATFHFHCLKEEASAHAELQKLKQNA